MPVTATPPPTKPSDEMDLMRTLWSPKLKNDPYAFVMFAFPWGQPGTPLQDQSGPRRWQADALKALAEHIAQNTEKKNLGLTPAVFRAAIVSGRGPGKSTLFSWLTLWMQSCHIGSTVIMTANTEAQLKTKTWAELGRWQTMAINSHWFDCQALSMRPQPWFDELLKKQLKLDTKYYYAVAQLWSEENPDAFAGAHNQYGMAVFFDEASGIPAPIWTVTEGFFTEPTVYRLWMVASNPRRNVGAFFECFHKNRDHWPWRRHIDSREVEGNDLAVLNGIIKQYGIDSDEAKVEVLGEFPARGDKQFISRRLIDDAANRTVQPDDWAPLIMGVDPARFGSDKAVIRFRRGRDARSIPPQKYRKLDDMELADRCAAAIDKYKPDAVCIDAGNGTGVIDRLRQLKYRVTEVWFGGESAEPGFGNKGTYLWAQMRDWLSGACIDADRDLMDDLANREYKFVGQTDCIRLESKDEMKRPPRNLPSPDDADALACTFAVRVARLDARTRRGHTVGRVAADVDAPVLG